MEIKQVTPFSKDLQGKIDFLSKRRTEINLGSVSFASPLLLAPMSNICAFPFRLLMEELGCGGTVSELISCHGINYGNEKTLRMLSIHPDEKNIGIQLFGESAESMALAAKVALESRPKFIDINMGCPVRKVVTKGSGSALLKDTSKLGHFFKTIKDAIDIPLTIKIRTGWDDDQINCKEVIHIAKEEGVEFVAIHGRTRTQQYKGRANWELLEQVAKESPLPIIGNGDLHSASIVKKRMSNSNCDAFMLARGPLRDPFIFLESYKEDDDKISFTPSDYWEITRRLFEYNKMYTDRERTILIMMRKHIIWFAAGLSNAGQFRNTIFKCPELEDTMKITEDYFLSLSSANKKINEDEAFMTSGHG
ncbi:tRNA-dihydrouridine synthase [Halobacteriovorax sp. HLS]|uniref:tRNA dihydrouridine synthase n=1 Tax=Halobacteriovorax sp. HLS TaxID=2234000 RepID=UPI000FD7E1F6|nr:tRNA-dihydrouridine synthase [Halobacteriovorax sp. HLS]